MGPPNPNPVPYRVDTAGVVERELDALEDRAFAAGVGQQFSDAAVLAVGTEPLADAVVVAIEASRATPARIASVLLIPTSSRSGVVSGRSPGTASLRARCTSHATSTCSRSRLSAASERCSASGATDADREVISNINPRGLAPVQAAHAIAEALQRILRDKKSGVVLG